VSAGRFTSECLSPYRSTVCTHHVDAGPVGEPLRCRPMGETPIYDQVRGERINADVPVSGVDPQWAAYHGKHRLRPDTPVPPAVFGPPGPGADLVPDHHRRSWTYPAGLSSADGQPAATVWGPRAAFPRRPTCGKRPDTPPAIPRRRRPTATQQPRAQRRGHYKLPVDFDLHHRIPVAFTELTFSTPRRSADASTVCACQPAGTVLPQQPGHGTSEIRRTGDVRNQ
jgi:hypothetical protein